MIARVQGSVLVVLLVLLATLIARPAFADPHTETLAKDALGKAQNDYLTANYAAAAARLKQAVHACGAKNCAPPIRAALLRDLGAMQFRSGDKTGASKSFSDALAIQPTLVLDPNYDASDVGAAYEDARAMAGLPAGPVSTKPPPGGASVPAGAPAPGPGAAAPPGAASAPVATTSPAAAPAPQVPMGEQPTGGDFAHEPPLEGKENTPLPVYAEYPGSSQLAHVVVKYKGAQMREWLRVELRHEGNGWEGLIPCGDVTRGVMRYWIQGFDKTREPVAASGDPKHPFFVPIRDKLTGEAPRLPGKDPPRSCEENDCPPGIPGCSKGKKTEGAEGTAGAAAGEGGTTAGADEGTEGGGEREKKETPGTYSRFWIGGAIAVDFLILPSASNVCKVDTGTPAAKPVNAAGYYCYGYDPPQLGGKGQNSNFPSNSAGNAAIVNGGDVAGGPAVGNLRLMAALDYAVLPNVLVGARVGYVFNSYPGRASAFKPVHLEARGTYVFGRAPLSHAGFAPIVFGGLGLSEFDGRATATNITVTAFPGVPQIEDAWLSDGPFFVVLGGGVRYQLSAHAALTGAIRLNLATGPVGLLPTFGPEIGVFYGF